MGSEPGLPGQISDKERTYEWTWKNLCFRIRKPMARTLLGQTAFKAEQRLHSVLHSIGLN